MLAVNVNSDFELWLRRANISHPHPQQNKAEYRLPRRPKCAGSFLRLSAGNE
jgi:hypothetical protein